jgi:ATP-dependent exoDNAse (exonuclease V) alpha subunit
MEQQIIDYAVRGANARRALALPARVEGAISARPTLAAEQEALIRSLAGDGSAVAIVVGQAGTGKTFALDAAREAWERSGYSVRGAAIARRAARELEAGAGVPSASVTELLNELARRPEGTLRRRSVLVLDEAGMISTRTLAQLMQHADRLELKLVLVGDHHQLPAIGAGGAFRGLVDRLPVIELRENRRQLEAWERDALSDLRTGDAPAAVGRYETARRVTIAEDADAVRRALVADWWKAADLGGAVMLAQRRVDVADLNGRAHAMLRAAGALGEDELRVGGMGMAAGDWVMVRRNDRALGVVNGERGEIVAVDRTQGSLEVDIGGRRVVLDREFLTGPARSSGASLTYGYAMTAHLAQGMTCRQTFVLASDSMSREGGYVALSRGRVANHLYVVASEPSERDEYAPASRDVPDPHAALVERLSRSQAQTLAVDTVEPRPRVVEQPMTERRGGRLLFGSREHGRELG